MSISEFLKYTFFGQLGKTQRVIDVAAIDVEPSGNELPKSSIPPPSRSKPILVANWIAAIICIASFFVVFIYALFYRSEPVPCIVENLLTSTLGWLGCSIPAYIEAKH